MNNNQSELTEKSNACVINFQTINMQKVKPIQKIVFSEPYDCMPKFIIDNALKKGDCKCLPKPKEKPKKCAGQMGGNFNFDIKKFLPLLIKFMGGSSNSNDISSLLSNMDKGFDFSRLLSNPNLLKNVFSLLSSNKKTASKKEEIICTDYEIKNYTKV